MANPKELQWIVGKRKDGSWVNIDLNLNTVNAPKCIDSSNDAWGRALAILWQHDALLEISILTEDEWFNHPASLQCGISHIDLGLEVLHSRCHWCSNEA